MAARWLKVCLQVESMDPFSRDVIVLFSGLLVLGMMALLGFLSRFNWFCVLCLSLGQLVALLGCAGSMLGPVLAYFYADFPAADPWGLNYHLIAVSVALL